MQQIKLLVVLDNQVTVLCVLLIHQSELVDHDLESLLLLLAVLLDLSV